MMHTERNAGHAAAPTALRSWHRTLLGLWCIGAVMSLTPAGAAQGETWRGLTVAPEHRCAPYDKKRDYPYPQSVEPEIVRALGAVYGPYTGTCFTSQTETDIEHIVAASEAHDSGLCARVSRAERNQTKGRSKTLPPRPSGGDGPRGSG